jgi:hypothetical protein
VGDVLNSASTANTQKFLNTWTPEQLAQLLEQDRWQRFLDALTVSGGDAIVTITLPMDYRDP